MSNDLVSRKLLLKELDEVIAQYNYKDDGVIVMDLLTCIRDMVYDITTAYDIGKVIERLEEQKQEEGNVTLTKIAYNTAIEDAIEIVKKGGVECFPDIE